MSTYTCAKCGMGVKGLTCAKCDVELVHSTITKDNGAVVHISSCPNCSGKIKSPLCCGEDMTCPI